MSELSHIPEELIELKAYQIWEKRQLDGREGTSQSDWKEAKQYLEEKKNRQKVRQWKFFRRITLWWEDTLVEDYLESIEFLLEKLAFFTILGGLGKLVFIVAVVSFVFGENVRRNNEVFAAWTTITTAHDQTGSGGRKRALEFLNSRPLRFPWIWVTRDLFGDEKECERKLVFGRRWKRESLIGLSAPKAYLRGINLCGAELSWANLQKAILFEANIQDSFLFGAKLQDAVLREAKLQDANLMYANLQNALLWETNLQRANLMYANLQNANLFSANLQNALLWEANLQKAILIEIENLTPEQIKSTCFWDRAIYKGEWNEEKRAFVVFESDNANYIEELKNDTASDSQYSIDCSRWEKEN